MRKTFYIIDGHAQIYRSYFAPFRDLTSPTGEPTKATFVFLQMLMNLIAKRKPDYLCMAIDSGDETVFRKAIFPEYKANRVSPPDDFRPQEQRILEIVREVGVPIFAKGGFEADDLIATFAKRLCGGGFEVIIVSKDKDLRQILNDCTHLYDVQGDELIDAKALEEKCGYTPAEAVEIQTLIGDSTDNVPGIPGVGEKTAVKLVKKYGSADAVLEHLSDLTPKLRENFEKFGDRLPMARQLVTLKDDVEIDFDPESCRFQGLRNDVLRQYVKTLGFTSLLSRLPSEPRIDLLTGAPVVARPPKAISTTPTDAAPLRSAGPALASVSGSLWPDAPSQPFTHQAPEADGAPLSAPEANTGAAKPLVFQEGLFSESSGTQDADSSNVLRAAAEDGFATCAGCTYTLINTDEQFEIFLADLQRQKRFAFDTETDDLGAMYSNLVGMSFSWQPQSGYYLPVRGPQESKVLQVDRVIEALRPILEDPAIAKVGHNIKYDLLVMRKAGVMLRGIALDSMIGTWLVDSSRLQYGIDRLAIELLRFRKIPTVDLLGKGKTVTTMDKVDLRRIATYAGEDADIALRLGDLVEQKLLELPRIKSLNDELETPLIDVLAEMEFNGIAIDSAVLKEQSDELGHRIVELRRRIYEAADGEFNIDSPKQLADVLYTRLKLRVIKKTPAGVPSTDNEVLDRLADKHPVPRLIQEYREWVKLKNTYLDNLTQYISPTTQRVHGSFNQTGTETGRLSMSDPNLQNIPIRTDDGRRIRRAFVPGDRRQNVLLAADYSQIELRILAHFTNEPALVRAFEMDEDIHRTVAAEVFNVPLEQVTRDQRGQAKTINFGIIYGVSAMGLARRIDGLTVKSAAELIAAYNRRFPTIQKFFDQCVAEAQDTGIVHTILGRRRPIPDINSGVMRQRNASQRMAINSVVQGSAADLIKLAMIRIYTRLMRENRPSRIILQVHDELVFETPAESAAEEAKMIREEMQGAMKLSVPLKVDVGWGKNWYEVK